MNIAPANNSNVPPRIGIGIVSDSFIDQVITRQPPSLCFGTRRHVAHFISEEIKHCWCIRYPVKASVLPGCCGMAATGMAFFGCINIAVCRPINIASLSAAYGVGAIGAIAGGLLCGITSVLCLSRIKESPPTLINAIVQSNVQINAPPSWLRYADNDPPIRELIEAIERVLSDGDRKRNTNIVNRDHLQRNLEVICPASRHIDFFDRFLDLIPNQCMFRYDYALFYLERIDSCEALLKSALDNLKRWENSPEFGIAESVIMSDEGQSEQPSQGFQHNVQGVPDNPDSKLQCVCQCMDNILSVAELHVAMILGFCAASINRVALRLHAADKAYWQNAQKYFKKIQALEGSARLTKSVADAIKHQKTSEEPSHGDSLALQSLAPQDFDHGLEQFNKVYGDFQTLRSNAGSLIDLLETLQKESIFPEPKSAVS